MTTEHSSNDPQPQSRSPARFWANSIGIGFGAGLLNGLIGVGGGILIVPGLVLMRGVAVRVAVATSLAAVLLLSVSALAMHSVAAWLQIAPFTLDPIGVLLLLIAGAFGSQAGLYLLLRLPARWVMFTFAGVMLISASQLLAIGLSVSSPLASAVAPPLWSYAAMGLATGFFSGVLGIGGGGLVVLLMSVTFHVTVLGGVPIALAANVTNSLAGVIGQWSSRQILWKEVRALVPSALVGVAVGTGLAVVMPADMLRVVFALFFIYMSISLIRRGRSL